MKNKLKYINIYILLIVFVVLIIEIPKLYFLVIDTKTKDDYKINSLNLTNLYENDNLSNEKKIKLLKDSNVKEITFVEKIDEEDYLELIEKVKEELQKIDEDSLKEFEELFNLDFKDIDINVTRRYISNDNYDSFSLKQINFFAPNMDVNILIDASNYTIFGLNATYYFDLEFDINKYDVEITDKYIKYLKINNNRQNIYAYRTSNSIVIDAYGYNETNKSIEGNE